MEGISIYSKRCWINSSLQPATVTFYKNRITAISNEKLDGARDFGDDVIMPGIIDAHVHVNEPGRTEWEGFDTATMAAAAGGITTIVDMPLNASPVTTTVDAFRQKLEASKDKLNVNCGFYGGLIPGHKKELELLAKEGILGVKCFLVHSGIDEFPNVTYNDIAEVLPFLAANALPLLAHCEVESPVQMKQDDPGKYMNYLSSRPKQWENDAVDMMIGLSGKFNASIHIVHVSSAETLPAIKEAKAAGKKVTAETCPQYIYFSADDIPDNDTLFKCAPPIREKENNGQLKAALRDGILDFIASDHSPAPPEIKKIKEGDLMKAWGGIAGLQFLLPASWTALKEIVSLETFIPLLTSHPAEFLKISDVKGKLEVGHDADFVIWSPEKILSVADTDILHRHKASPYTGKKMCGTITSTIVNGTVVFENNKIINKKAGKWVFRK